MQGAQYHYHYYKVFANDFLACGGGPAANAAVQIAKLGGYVHFTEYEITCRSHIVQFAKLNVEKSKRIKNVKSSRAKSRPRTTRSNCQRRDWL
jgi:hypothetical protein